MNEEQKCQWRKKYHEDKHKDWYIKARRERGKRFREKHPFKIMEKSLKKKNKDSTVTAKQLSICYKKQKGFCALTGRKLTSHNISPDHIQHKSKGGLCSIENIRLVVKDVNFARHTLEDIDFIQLCKDVVSHN